METMKILRLHPLMTMSLLRVQFGKLLHCNVTVYLQNQHVAAFQTLREAGLRGEELLEFYIDETLTLREFEGAIQEGFNLDIELTDDQGRPFSSKSLQLYQVAGGDPGKKDPPSLDRLAEWLLEISDSPTRTRYNLPIRELGTGLGN